jgi:plastocyanin
VGDPVLKAAAIVLVGVASASAAAVARAAPNAERGRVVGKVTVTEADGKPATGADVIVYVVGYVEPPGKTVAQIAQTGRKFVPDLVAITAGEQVNFPNRDAFFHNVFSESNARKFDLGSFKKGEAKSKDFPNLGVVDVYCNIHPEMAATILVLPNHGFTHVRADGTFAIDGVRPGTWKVFAYTRRAIKPAIGAVTVVGGKDTTIELTVARGANAAHANKFGAKYHDETHTY